MKWEPRKISLFIKDLNSTGPIFHSFCISQLVLLLSLIVFVVVFNFNSFVFTTTSSIYWKSDILVSITRLSWGRSTLLVSTRRVMQDSPPGFMQHDSEFTNFLKSKNLWQWWEGRELTPLDFTHGTCQMCRIFTCHMCRMSNVSSVHCFTRNFLYSVDVQLRLPIPLVKLLFFFLFL